MELIGVRSPLSRVSTGRVGVNGDSCSVHYLLYAAERTDDEPHLSNARDKYLGLAVVSCETNCPAMRCARCWLLPLAVQARGCV